MDYAKLSTKFWTGETGRSLRQAGLEPLVVALYLISNPHANMLGFYYLPIVFIAHETNLSEQKAKASLKKLIDLNFCEYDYEAEFVWICEMARFQIADRLKPNDKQIIAINRLYGGLPKNNLLKIFYEHYGEKFHITLRRGIETKGDAQDAPSEGLGRGIEDPSKPVTVSVAVTEAISVTDSNK